jgi:hypothetical protein
LRVHVAPLLDHREPTRASPQVDRHVVVAERHRGTPQGAGRCRCRGPPLVETALPICVVRRRPCENRPFARDDTMDNEQINAIGTLLADLSARTQQLRGYL